MIQLPDANEPVSKGTSPRIVTGVLGLLVFTLLWFGIAGRCAQGSQAYGSLGRSLQCLPSPIGDKQVLRVIAFASPEQLHSRK
jgi:hypothetical protein